MTDEDMIALVQEFFAGVDSENIDRVLEKLEAAGGRVLEGSVIAIPGSLKVLMALDPDGTRLEIIDAPGDPGTVPGSV